MTISLRSPRSTWGFGSLSRLFPGIALSSTIADYLSVAMPGRGMIAPSGSPTSSNRSSVPLHRSVRQAPSVIRSRMQESTDS